MKKEPCRNSALIRTKEFEKVYACTVWQGSGLGRELISYANVLLPAKRQSGLHLITFFVEFTATFKGRNKENKVWNKSKTNRKASNSDSYWNWSRINAFVLSSTDCMLSSEFVPKKIYVNLLSELFFYTTTNKKHFINTFSSKHVLVLL